MKEKEEQEQTSADVEGKGTDLIDKAMDAIAQLKTRVESQVDELSKQFQVDTLQESSSIQRRIISDRADRSALKRRRSRSLSFDQDLSSPEGLGLYLKAWRLKKRLSQSEVAVAIDAAQSWYSMLEGGLIPSPDRARLANLARLYNQDPKRFFAGSAYKDVYNWRPSTKPRAGFCPNLDCPGLRTTRTRFYRKCLLLPQYFSQTIFKPRSTCHICNSTLIVRCEGCHFPIQRKGERYCSDCQAFHFVSIAKEILNLNSAWISTDSDPETRAVIQIELKSQKTRK